VGRSGWIIQLAAADSEAKARTILDTAREKNSLLRKAEPFTESVTKGNSTLFRARFAGFDAADDANAACKALKRSGFNCFAQRI
jgi:D-alanyl-D-alanine carboxypeptidase